MATNKPIGDNARVGAVKGRSQVFNPVTGLWTKRTWVEEYALSYSYRTYRLGFAVGK